MTVADLARDERIEVLALPSPERVIDGVYIGDLLSWVMGRASANQAWITIMSNVNVIAVASLTDISCVILAEGVKPDMNIISTANDKGINLLSTSLTAYEAAILLNKRL